MKTRGNEDERHGEKAMSRPAFHFVVGCCPHSPDGPVRNYPQITPIVPVAAGFDLPQPLLSATFPTLSPTLSPILGSASEPGSDLRRRPSTDAGEPAPSPGCEDKD
jgi:hypothetical protein